MRNVRPKPGSSGHKAGPLRKLPQARRVTTVSKTVI